MANVAKFKIKGVPKALTNYYNRVCPTNDRRTIIHSGNTLNVDSDGNATVQMGDDGTIGQEVEVYAGETCCYRLDCGGAVVSSEGGEPLTYDNIVFLGSSTSDRAFNSAENIAEMQEFLQEQGLPLINLVAETQSGSSAPYQADTLMPQAVANNSSLENVLFFGQSPTNSLTQAFSTETQAVKDTLQGNIESIINQANTAGWTPLYSNFNKTPEAAGYEIEQWNDSFLTPIVSSLAPQSIESGVYVQDYEKLGGISNYLFSSRDGVHLAEVSGDRLYRQYSATNIARFMGSDLRKDLSGRRVVVQPTSSNRLDWGRIQNITPIPLGLGSSPYMHLGANLVDADTGEVLPDLYVALKGTRGINSGAGNAGDSSSSYLNDDVLKKCAWIGVDETEGFYLEIGSFTQTLPAIERLTLAGNRNSTGSDRKGEWLCNGETKILDGALRPCGTAEFLNVPAVDNKITAVGALQAGSNYSYLSAIEFKFA